MAKTAVADIIIPTEFEKYAIERTAELSAFGECGIVEMAPEFDELAAGGGREVKMPFWKDLTATRDGLTLSFCEQPSCYEIESVYRGSHASLPCSFVVFGCCSGSYVRTWPPGVSAIRH